ncbi:Protein kintoun [Diplonema papillatum]|nr:Protein kintoun [Diplonema papillatum]
MANMTDAEVKKMAEECLGDGEFITRFQQAVGDEPIPDPAKDPEKHTQFMRRVQERMAEAAMREKEGEVFEDKDGTSWCFTLPRPEFCIKAGDESGAKKVFINICSSPSIAEPQPMTQTEVESSGMQNEALQFRVPISIGPPRVDVDKAGKQAMVYDIAVNPLTLDKCGKDAEFKRLVCAMCLYGLKQKHEPDLNQDQYKTPNLKCKGTPVMQRVRVTASSSKNAFNNEINLGTAAAPGTMTGGSAAPGIRIPGVGAPDDEAAPDQLPNSGGGGGSNGASKPTAPLIQELGEDGRPVSQHLAPGEGVEALYRSTKLAEDEGDASDAQPEAPARFTQVSHRGDYDWAKHRKPELNAYWRSRVNVPETTVATIHLPEVQATVAECNVDVQPSEIVVYAVDDEELAAPYCRVPLQFPVDPDTARAKFSKKKKHLTLELTVDLPDELQQRQAVVDATKREEQVELDAQAEKDAAAKREADAARARYERTKKEEDEQQSFNKQLVETAKALQAGGVPPEMQGMIDSMPPSEAQGLYARLLDGRMKGDSVDQILEKLPRPSIEALISALRSKLGLAEPEQPKANPTEPATTKPVQTEAEAEDELYDASYGNDKLSKRLFGVQLHNRFVFGLDL